MLPLAVAVFDDDASKRLALKMLLAASLGESDPQLYVDIGDTEQGLGHTVEARAAYRMALTIDPFFTPARQRMAGEGTASS